MGDMSAYLETRAADYTATILVVTPGNIIIEEGLKNQIVYEMDEGPPVVVTLGASYFLVTLEWPYLSDTGGDVATLQDLWHNASKANGLARTFYWQHPKSLKIYTARFTGPLREAWSGKRANGVAIYQVVLRVEANKP